VHIPGLSQSESGWAWQHLARGNCALRRLLVLLVAVCLTSAASLRAESSGCPKRVVRMRITEADIAQTEQATAQGHQPWRGNPHSVAEAALVQVELGIDPRTIDSVPSRRTVLSATRESFRFELNQRHHVDQVSLRRFHWRNPQTGRTQLTVWWATSVVILDCSKQATK